MARKTLTDRGVAALKPRSKLYAHADPQMPGHYVRVTPAGARSYAVMAGPCPRRHGCCPGVSLRGDRAAPRQGHDPMTQNLPARDVGAQI